MSTTLTAEEEIDAMIMTVQNSKLALNLPSYLKDVTPKIGTVPSSRDYLECRRLLAAHFAKTPSSQHPASQVEKLLKTSNVSFNPVQVSTKDEVFVVRRGYLVEDPETSVADITCAFASTMLAYYVRGDGEASLKVPLDNATATILNLPTLDLVVDRSRIGNFTKSAVKARDEMYGILKENIPVAMHTSSKILSKLPDQFSEEHPTSNVSLVKYYDAKNVLSVNRYKFKIPIAGPIKVIKSIDVTKAWRLLAKSRGFRGEDNAGIGVLSIGYYWFEMNRTMVKYISRIHDLINFMKFCGVTVLILGHSSKLPEFIVKSLILNGYTVVDEYSNAPSYSDEPGFYSTYSVNVRRAKLITPTFEKPQVKSKIVEWPRSNLNSILKQMDMINDDVSSAVEIVFCFGLLLKGMGKEFTYFPTTMPHNGSVIITKLMVKGYSFDSLVVRMASSNCFRNNFPFNRVGYYSVDPMTEFTNPTDNIILPRIGKEESDVDVFDFVDIDVKDVPKENKLSSKQKLRVAPKKNEPMITSPMEIFTFLCSLDSETVIQKILAYLNFGDRSSVAFVVDEMVTNKEFEFMVNKSNFLKCYEEAEFRIQQDKEKKENSEEKKEIFGDGISGNEGDELSGKVDADIDPNELGKLYENDDD